jgi:uncharacterized protein (DUF2141 family)
MFLFLTMNIKAVILLTSFLTVSATGMAQYRLEIEVTGLRNDKGTVMLQLMDAEKQTVTERMDSIKGGKCSLLIGDIKAGKYAIRYFHDENLSGKMETNDFGIPVEGYGFSNNVNGLFGPPPFVKWVFEVTEDTKINLKPKY